MAKLQGSVGWVWRGLAVWTVLWGSGCYPDSFPRDNPNDPDGTGYVAEVDADKDGYKSTEDCDDSDPDVHPGATELCNQLDDDCNNKIDDGLALTNYFLDEDGDGYGTGDAHARCDGPGENEVVKSGDCDDDNAAVHPGSREVCNGLDDDCNDDIDDGLTTHTYYEDGDRDGYGAGSATETCQSPTAGQVTENGDCDDNNNTVYPGAVELCNAVDDNCDLDIDEGLASTTFYTDGDKDGYGAIGSEIEHCGPASTGEVLVGGDCDDEVSAVHPDVTEVCNSIDDNCDGEIDEGLKVTTYYPDADEDGYGATASPASHCGAAHAGEITVSGDCDDASASVNPAASEACNGIDDNCDDQVDEGFITEIYYPDVDGDGYGDSSSAQESCVPLEGYITEGGDCDDSRLDVNPKASETCDGTDQNCDGESDYKLDEAGDGIPDCDLDQDDVYIFDGDCDDQDRSVYPGALEVFDGVSNNCEGVDLDIDLFMTASTQVTGAAGQGYGRRLIMTELDRKLGDDVLVQVGTTEASGLVVWSGPSLSSSTGVPLTSFMLGESGGGTAVDVGDFDDNGYEDVAASAFLSRGAGTVYLFLGSSKGWKSGGYTSATASFSIDGADSGFEDGDSFGASMLAINADDVGVTELLVGVPDANEGAGALVLFTLGLETLRIEGETAGDRLGAAMSTTTEGGVTTVWVSAPGANSGGGRVYGLEDLAVLLKSGQTRQGIEAASRTSLEQTDAAVTAFGTELAGIDDDGSGNAALLVTGSTTGTGLVYRVTGPLDFNAGTEASTTATIYKGEAGREKLTGQVAWVGDIDHDSIQDFTIAGVTTVDGASSPVARAFLVYGGAKDSCCGSSDTPGASWRYPEASMSTVVSVAGGDLDGDGRDDLLVGVNGYSADGATQDGYLGVVMNPFPLPTR